MPHSDERDDAKLAAGSETVPSAADRPAAEPRFRPYRPGDERQIVDVFAAAFERWSPFLELDARLRLVEWLGAPEAAPWMLVTVGELDGRIVAVEANGRRRVKLRDGIVDGALGGGGLAVHPDFQRRGIHGALRRWRRERHPVEISLNFAVVAPVRRGATETSVPVGDQMAVFLRILRPQQAAAAHSLRARLPRLAGYGALALWGATRARLRRPRPRRATVPVERFDARFDALWEAAAPQWDVIPVRDAAYLNWRYADPRAVPYRVFAVEEAADVLGYVAVRVDGERAYIGDLLAAPGRDDVVRALLDRAAEHARGRGASVLECWMMRRHRYAPLLGAAGFLRSRVRSAERARGFFVGAQRINRGELAFLQDRAATVHFLEADSDASFFRGA